MRHVATLYRHGTVQSGAVGDGSMAMPLSGSSAAEGILRYFSKAQLNLRCPCHTSSTVVSVTRRKTESGKGQRGNKPWSVNPSSRVNRGPGMQEWRKNAEDERVETWRWRLPPCSVFVFCSSIQTRAMFGLLQAYAKTSRSRHPRVIFRPRKPPTVVVSGSDMD